MQLQVVEEIHGGDEMLSPLVSEHGEDPFMLTIT